MIKCLQIQFGVMSEEGKFLRDGFMSLASMGAGEKEEKLKAAEEIADECSVISNEDLCEQAFLLAKCMHDEAVKRKLTAE